MLYGILAAFAVLIVILDQVTKYMTVSNIPLGGIVPFWDGLFHFTYIQNTGMAFSMLEGGRWFFLIMTAAAFVLLVITLKKGWITHPTGLWALASITGGAIGNLIDRIFNDGKVIDMFYIKLIDFPIFNVADLFVTLPGGLFCLLLIREIIAEEKAKKTTALEENNEDHDSGTC